MSNLNVLFRKRIGFQINEELTFEQLPIVLMKMAKNIPFENLRVVNNNMKDITLENVVENLLIKNEGGLCFDLNPLLYHFLLENHFNVCLVKGVIYNHFIQDWSSTGNTHVLIILKYEKDLYLIDSGFGKNVPLKPVPLNGKSISSENGEFRIRKTEDEEKPYILEMKLFGDLNWKNGYAFDVNNPIFEICELNKIQQIISEHPLSPFNKGPIMAKLIEEGSISLTDTTCKIVENGEVHIENIDVDRFRELRKQYFTI
ncbi:arylamine N-acetyltransferase family protein [Bacillus sp. JJ722]|uniref:arylamine N-acetyltransferase family protein n=1 Tax=Bacillus sp. JJ722 TaxID=3122973 RepID=UPI002FFF0AE3